MARSHEKTDTAARADKFLYSISCKQVYSERVEPSQAADAFRIEVSLNSGTLAKSIDLCDFRSEMVRQVVWGRRVRTRSQASLTSAIGACFGDFWI